MSQRTRTRFTARQRDVDVRLSADYNAGTQRGVLSIVKAGVETVVAYFTDTAFQPQMSNAPAATVDLGSTASPYRNAYLSGLTNESAADALTAVGTTQATGLQLTKTINRVTVGASTTGVNLPASAPGLEITVINSVANSIHVYPVIGGTETINGSAATVGIIQAPNTSVKYQCSAAGVWTTTVATMPQTQYLTASNTTNFTLTSAQVAGASDTTLNVTGALGSGQTITMPVAAVLLAGIPNAYVGQSFKLRICNTSSGNFAWTVTTATGWTLNGTMTIAQNTYRDFVVTLTSLTAFVIQSINSGIQNTV